jgi:phosphoglycerol transferase
MKKRRILKIIELVFCTFFIIIFFFSFFVNYNFGDISFEQVIFNIIYSEGADYTILYKGVSYCLFLLILFYLLVYFKHWLYLFLKIKVCIKIGFKNKIININIFEKTFLKTFLFLLIFGGFTVYKSFDYLNLKEYIDSQKTASTLFEDYYVDGRDVKIEFPEKKRNLIYIYLESMESSYVSKGNGGVFEKSLIPNLEKLALENINFSNTDKIGGAFQLHNTSWTMAALVSSTGGIPLKVRDGNNYIGDKIASSSFYRAQFNL